MGDVEHSKISTGSTKFRSIGLDEDIKNIATDVEYRVEINETHPGEIAAGNIENARDPKRANQSWEFYPDDRSFLRI